jgi:glycosyltransferase involved in cell wall biosynthesis/cell division septation protein DedD
LRPQRPASRRRPAAVVTREDPMAHESGLRIAMIGSKGLPASFGGIERHVEEIGGRLAARGHEVVVFGRRPFCTSGTYRGMQVRLLPSIPTKNLETATNSLTATMAALFKPYDVIHYHGIGPSLFSWIPSMLGRVTVATIHAPDYRQRKWGPIARRLLRRGERAAVLDCDAAISVSRLMARELESRYGRAVRYIPNGAHVADPVAFGAAERLGVEDGGYILTVGRFIVEKGFHTLIRAFRRVRTDLKLVIVGDARFEEAYAARLRRLAGDRVLFPGYIAGPLLDELYAHCAFYVLPSLVEGLSISLLEAMGSGCPVLVSDIPENLEVSEGIALTFERDNEEDLARDARHAADGRFAAGGVGTAGTGACRARVFLGSHHRSDRGALPPPDARSSAGSVDGGAGRGADGIGQFLLTLIGFFCYVGAKFVHWLDGGRAPMNGWRCAGRPAALLAAGCLLFVFLGCTQPAVREGVRTDIDREVERPERAVPPEEGLVEEESPAIYDLEEEMQPEELPADPDELEQDIEPLVPDSVSIEEITVDETAGSRHDLGYRIQVFALGDLSRARATADSVTAQTGYPAYIEYEGGLYKVRVGNFSGRKAAAEARAKLVELYPDCWIVQTTIQR